MATWQWILGPASGGHTIGLTRARDRKVAFKLTDASSASFAIGGRNEEANAVRELASDLHVVRDGVPLYRGRVGTTADNVDATVHVVEVQTLDYREVLNRRLLWNGDQLVFGQTDQAQIAWTLVEQTQRHEGGGLGIIRGAGSSSGILRDRSDYKFGDSVGALINELAELVDGFDWDIVPVDHTVQRLDLWHGVAGRGVDRGVILEYGGGVASVRRTVTVDTFANAVRVTGADATLVETRTTDGLTDPALHPEGRWDGVYGYPTIATQSQLAERAEWQLADSQVIRPTYTVNLTPNAWQGPGHIWLGDTVQLRVRSGRLTVDTPLRVYQLDVDVNLTGDETVQLTLGGPKPDYRRRPTDVSRRLRNLERR